MSHNKKSIEDSIRDSLEVYFKDLGDVEPAAMYDSDMAVYVGSRSRRQPPTETERNIELMKRWAAEGK